MRYRRQTPPRIVHNPLIIPAPGFTGKWRAAEKGRQTPAFKAAPADSMNSPTASKSICAKTLFESDINVDNLSMRYTALPTRRLNFH
jgi:hypothetical protein